MTPSIVITRMSAGSDRSSRPLLVLGPALGTSAEALWRRCADELGQVADVVAWDLPGHGHNDAVADEAVTVADLARGVLAIVDDVLTQRGEAGATFCYAGVSVGGAVGLQLALDAPHRLSGLAVLCSAARIGEPESWQDRARQVRAEGTASLVEASTERWFGPGFVDADPQAAAGLLAALVAADDTGYVQVCEALAGFDVRDRLSAITTPVLAVAGSHDVATPPDGLREVASRVEAGHFAELAGVGHLAPAERPHEVATLLRTHLLGAPGGAEAAAAGTDRTAEAQDETYLAGMRVRREVLGDDHVDRAVAATTDLTRDFQELITRYAWGSVWTRPGLDRRSRSIVTLTALVARGHHEELAMHLQAARRNGLTLDEIREVLLQTAVYCGVPDANTAFRIAQRVFPDEEKTNP
jgi:3-oxoadipate enol-lactonase/4-carboxymuconolactone decarboxylase